MFAEHSGEYEDDVKRVIRYSLEDMSRFRPHLSGELRMELARVECTKEPVTAVVAALFCSEGWQSMALQAEKQEGLSQPVSEDAPLWTVSSSMTGDTPASPFSRGFGLAVVSGRSDHAVRALLQWFRHRYASVQSRAVVFAFLPTIDNAEMVSET
jgi:hypothetical protein